MNAFPSEKPFKADVASAKLLHYLKTNESALGLGQAALYHAFPLYRDDEWGLVRADCVLVSRRHGVVPFALSSDGGTLGPAARLRCQEVAEAVPSHIQSRLVKNRSLRAGPTRLAFDITPVAFAPLADQALGDFGLPVLRTEAEIGEFLQSVSAEMTDEQFRELLATIEGAKGLIRPRKRDLADHPPTSKGHQAQLLEAAITLFDEQQKKSMMGPVNGPQRIRGLAGSGKTVVMAMKVALILLQNPDARIAYTFYTRSLHQHVKRLITRFYRQFDDRDPDWENNVHVLHGWGGQDAPGLYAVACKRHGVQPISYTQAAMRTTEDKFGFVCQNLLDQVPIRPIYDYIFVDEGQDFPLSFVRLCHRLAEGGRFVLAYDDLQTIWHAKTPSSAEIFSSNTAGQPLASFEEDIILHKCYRNPREVLVTAHALGFGIYGRRIVQMLDSRDHWEDVGYRIKSGSFVEGEEMVVERPPENSLTLISDRNPPDEIVKASHAESFQAEVGGVVAGVVSDVADGLRPEDILVVCVDDRSAKQYLADVERELRAHQIACNNLHGDSFGIRDFAVDGRVTLSTVHKAKGNEAFMVYVVGSDATMHFTDVRKRNMLFTALTRAKGWVRVSGVGEGAASCAAEVGAALARFPSLVFRYPAPGELKLMKRDLAEAADKKLKIRRALEEIQEDASPEEIEQELKRLQSEGKRASKR